MEKAPVSRFIPKYNRTMKKQTLTYLLAVFIGLLVILPLLQKFGGVYSVSGFEDYGCKQGEKPCPEGYFCGEKSSCVSVYPPYKIDDVKPRDE